MFDSSLHLHREAPSHLLTTLGSSVCHRVIQVRMSWFRHSLACSVVALTIILIEFTCNSSNFPSIHSGEFQQ